MSLWSRFQLLFTGSGDPFPLLDIPLQLQEMVLTKVSFFFIDFQRRFQTTGKSYFRMRQTCKAISTLAQSNKNINAVVEGEYGMACQMKDDGSIELCFNKGTHNINIHDLYGIRFDSLELAPG